MSGTFLRCATEANAFGSPACCPGDELRTYSLMSTKHGKSSGFLWNVYDNELVYDVKPKKHVLFPTGSPMFSSENQ